jgi:hypothetical protein
MADLLLLTDGVDTFRFNVRDSHLCTDQALTATGFDGTESTDGGVTGDWVNWEVIPPVE